MPGPRHRARELALKTLFQLERPGADADEVLAYLAAEEGASRQVTEFATDLVHGVLQNRDQIDSGIRAASTNWRPEQMGRVDRTVLRIAVYEIIVARQVPMRVAINESIELAKTFAGEESGRFVNGVLGNIAALHGG